MSNVDDADETRCCFGHTAIAQITRMRIVPFDNCERDTPTDALKSIPEFELQAGSLLRIT